MPVTAVERQQLVGTFYSQAHGMERRHTECITTTKESIKRFKLAALDTLELTLVAHHLDFMAVMHDIEE